MKITTNKDRVDQLEFIVSTIRSWQGKLIKINEFIARGNSLDRHLTTASSFQFTCTNSGLAFSGNRLTVDGDNGYYEIAFDYVVEVIFEDGVFEITERFSNDLRRVSKITIAVNN